MPGLVFMVSTTSFGEGRGDLFVATGLGRYLRRLPFTVGYLDQSDWYQPSPARAVGRGHDAGVPALQVGAGAEDHWLGTERVLELAHPSRAGSIRCHPLLIRPLLRMNSSGSSPALSMSFPSESTSSCSSRTRAPSDTSGWEWCRPSTNGGESATYTEPFVRCPSIFRSESMVSRAGLPSELARYDEGPVHFFELPKVYWGASIVLDDSNWTTVGWGAVNSRVFEAIAAGALPVTNSSPRTRLARVVRRADLQRPEELNPLVDRLLGDIDGTAGTRREAGRGRERAAFIRGAGPRLRRDH